LVIPSTGPEPFITGAVLGSYGTHLPSTGPDYINVGPVLGQVS